MEVIVCENAEKASALSARLVKNKIKKQPDLVLGLATGSTPLQLYKQLVDLIDSENLSVKEITTFNLDEYVGVAATHPGSYQTYMKKNLFEALNLREDQWHIPNGECQDVSQECQHYENLIDAKGPIQLQILGIGRDGHIGFNEPGSSFGSRTRLKTLTEETRQDNALLFSSTEEIPRHVITMGIQTIMDSEEIVLLAFGAQKADAVAAFIEGPVSASVPASILQFHPRVKVFLDPQAAAKLSHLDYYQEVFAQKPSWQMLEFES